MVKSKRRYLKVGVRAIYYPWKHGSGIYVLVKEKKVRVIKNVKDIQYFVVPSSELPDWVYEETGFDETGDWVFNTQLESLE